MPRPYNAPRHEIEDRTIIVVDDRVATGSTITAALRAIRKRKPKLLVAAVPIASAEALDHLSSEADEIICLSAPEQLGAVGVYYRDFLQTSDEEVIALIRKSAVVEPERDVGFL